MKGLLIFLIWQSKGLGRLKKVLYLYKNEGLSIAQKGGIFFGDDIKHILTYYSRQKNKKNPKNDKKFASSTKNDFLFKKDCVECEFFLLNDR